MLPAFAVSAALSRHDLEFQHALGGGGAGHQVVQLLGHVPRFRGDGDAGAAVGGDGLVDGQNIGAGIGENGQIVGQDAGVVLQQRVKGDDVPCVHVLEGLHRVLIFIEGAAADAHQPRGLAHGGGLAYLQHPLGLRHPEEDLRQSVRRHQIKFLFFHDKSSPCPPIANICVYMIAYIYRRRKRFFAA